MERHKVILLFTALDGTILREEDKRYSKGMMYKVLEQINKMQMITHARVRWYLVSPKDEFVVSYLMNEIDKNIFEYNKILCMVQYGSMINKVQGALATQLEDLKTRKYKKIDKRVFAFRKNSSSDPAGKGNLKYVKQWIMMTDDERAGSEVYKIIYAGSSLYEMPTMEYIKKEKHGYVIVPDNAEYKVKKRGTTVTQYPDLQGVAAGLERINKQFEKELKKESKENTVEEV